MVTWLFDHRENTFIIDSRPGSSPCQKCHTKTKNNLVPIPSSRMKSASLSLSLLPYLYFNFPSPNPIHFLPNLSLLWSLCLSLLSRLVSTPVSSPPPSKVPGFPHSCKLYPFCPSPDKCPAPRGQPARRPALSLPTYCEEQLRPPHSKSQVQVTRRAQRIRALPRSSPWEPESLSPRSYMLKVRQTFSRQLTCRGLLPGVSPFWSTLLLRVNS